MKKRICILLCIVLGITQPAALLAEEEYLTENFTEYGTEDLLAGLGAELDGEVPVEPSSDLIMEDVGMISDGQTDDASAEAADGLVSDEGDTLIVESVPTDSLTETTQTDLSSGLDITDFSDIPADLADGIEVLPDDDTELPGGTGTDLLTEETAVFSETGEDEVIAEAVETVISEMPEETEDVSEEQDEPDTEETEDLFEEETEEETEEELILTATEEGELHDPTVSPDEAVSQVSTLRTFGVLRSRALGASAYSGCYGNQLTGFSKTCYDARASYYLSNKTGGFSLTYTSSNSPLTFEARVSGGALVNKSDGYIDYATRMAVEKAMQSSLDAFCYDHPEVFWTRKGSYTIHFGAYKNKSSSTGYTGYVSSITYTPDEIFSGASGLISTFQSSVNRVYSSLVSDSATDLDHDQFVSDTEFIYAAHNYICSRVTYAREEYNSYLSSTASFKNYRIFSPYDVFAGSAGSRVVCEGYSRAMKILCDRAGIGCACIAGDNHMWNAVQLNGTWYLMDLTWDDGETIAYTYFLAAADSAHKQNGDFSGSGMMTFTYPPVSYTAATYRLGAFNYVKGTCTGEDTTGDTYNIANAKISAVPAQTYTGSAIKPSLTVRYGVTELTNGKHYTLSYSSNTSAGTASVTVTGIGIFSGSKTVSFTIAKRSLSGLSLLALPEVTYTGSAITPDVTIKYGSAALVKERDYTLSYQNNVNAGTAVVTVTGKGNYTGTRTAQFTIRPRSLSLASADAIPAQVYTGGKALTPAVTLRSGSVVLKNGTDYTLSWLSNKNPGTASVTAAGRGNWTGTKKLTFRINARDFTSVSVSIPDTTYTGKARKPAPSVSVGGVTLVNGRDYTISYKNNKKIGIAKATLTGLGYYYGSRTVSFRIIPKTPKISKAKSSSKKKMQVKWKKVSKASGYQIQYARDPSFADPTTVRTGSSSKTISRLKRKTWYYVRVRSYTKVKKKYYYSGWSAVKRVKIK